MRVINTDVTSKGFRTDLIAQFDAETGDLNGLIGDDENLIAIEDDSSYTEILPSLSLVFSPIVV